MLKKSIIKVCIHDDFQNEKLKLIYRYVQRIEKRSMQVIGEHLPDFS